MLVDNESHLLLRKSLLDNGGGGLGDGLLMTAVAGLVKELTAVVGLAKELTEAVAGWKWGQIEECSILEVSVSSLQGTQSGSQ